MNHELETKVRNFSRSQRLQSWADLFGYTLEMGRDPKPFVEVDGIHITDPDPFQPLIVAAKIMGMDWKDFKGTK